MVSSEAPRRTPRTSYGSSIGQDYLGIGVADSRYSLSQHPPALGAGGKALRSIEWSREQRRSDGLGQDHRQSPRSANRAFRPPGRSLRVEPEFWDPRQPFRQRAVDLHAGECGADATVDAEPERDVAVLGAVDNHMIGILEHFRVAVRSRKCQQH